MRRIRVTLAAAAVVVVAALTGCSTSGDTGESQAPAPVATTQATATAPVEPAVDVAAPTIGQCWTLPDLVSGQTWHTWGGAPAVDCAAEHTAVTFAVAELPDEAYPATDAQDELVLTEALGSALDSACFTPTEKQRVGTRIYAFLYFPTAEQWAAGARWARCDLSVLALGPTSTTVLAPLTQAPDEILAAAHTSYQTCVDTPLDAATHGPGDGWAEASLVDCAGPHQWKYADGWTLDDAEYPGVEETAALATQMCSDIREILLGAYSSVFWPSTQAEWDSGSRDVQCWISPRS